MAVEDFETGAPTASRFRRSVPDGDTVERNVCRDCGFVAYENPKLVVGSVVRAGSAILLCRRAIEPRRGYWTLPAGYLELGETPEDGARREAFEEAGAEIRLHALLAVYSVPRISQVQLIYRAELAGPFAAGPESLEVRLFEPDELPWSELAFPSVEWALEHEQAVRSGTAPAPFVNPAGETGERFRGRPAGFGPAQPPEPA
ncbi:NUDIX hydrolase [Prosthecomicrobium hirschii]|uniref:NUDIX hydrolase n=1 Tax=Prosthecodimorpha hirschii TaxID=665126 RepID=A0A0P6VRC2_9HYPH|nr:NUDIX hydrolase [Prosthecomicrobium hirschii]KPL53138.1 NUDIX hydrolase [Prosthecomicrobium hirschii]